MKSLILTGIAGVCCVLPLMGCVVPAEPVRPVAVYSAPVAAPIVVGPPVVVARPRYYRRGYRGRPVYVRRGPHWRRY